MRTFRITITLLAITAAMVLVLGMLSGKTQEGKSGAVNEPVCGQEIDATRNVLMCI
jgi:hypothetical protein